MDAYFSCFLELKVALEEMMEVMDDTLHALELVPHLLNQEIGWLTDRLHRGVQLPPRLGIELT